MHFHSHCFLSCCVLCGGFISPWFLFNSTPREMPVSAFFALFCFACSFLSMFFWLSLYFLGEGFHWYSWGLDFHCRCCVLFFQGFFYSSSLPVLLLLHVSLNCGVFILAFGFCDCFCSCSPFFKEDYFGGALIGS